MAPGRRSGRRRCRRGTRDPDRPPRSTRRRILKWETFVTVGAPASSGLITGTVSNAQILFYANTFPVKLAAVSDVGLKGNPYVYADGMFGTTVGARRKGAYPTGADVDGHGDDQEGSHRRPGHPVRIGADADAGRRPLQCLRQGARQHPRAAWPRPTPASTTPGRNSAYAPTRRIALRRDLDRIPGRSSRVPRSWPTGSMSPMPSTLRQPQGAAR